jgi:hypothetical protein
MESIAEEKSELAMDIAQAVMEKLDIDRKLDERMKVLMHRGDTIFRDIQIRQEQSTEALCRTVGMCVESQRAFQEEHQRLLSAVKELATMVMPFTPLHAQAVDAQAKANAILEETEALKKQMEEHRTSTACAGAAVAALFPTSTQPLIPTAQQPALVTTSSPAPSTLQLGSGSFNITLRKADDVSLGLSVNADEEENKALIVEAVLAGGAVESWNRQCIGDGTGERVVVPGDRIVKVNGIEHDVKKMLEACTGSRLVKLQISRRSSGAAAHTPEKQPQSAAAAQEAADFATPEKSSLRKKAPEFVPSGADAKPLGQTQHLAAPPGLFFPAEDAQKVTGLCFPSEVASDSSDIAVKTESAASTVSHAYGVAVGMQEALLDEDSDKEN